MSIYPSGEVCPTKHPHCYVLLGPRCYILVLASCMTRCVKHMHVKSRIKTCVVYKKRDRPTVQHGLGTRSSCHNSVRVISTNGTPRTSSRSHADATGGAGGARVERRGGDRAGRTEWRRVVDATPLRRTMGAATSYHVPDVCRSQGI